MIQFGKQVLEGKNIKTITIRKMSDNANAKKLAVAIGILKARKCTCCKSDTSVCGSRMGMPISEIDGVKNIGCNIQFYQGNKGLGFEVTTEFKYDGEEDEHPRLYWKSKYNEKGINKDDILAFSIELLDELPRIKLGLCGVLLIRDIEYVSLRDAFEEVFTTIECENIKVDKTGVCSVCYEKTDTMTPCGHALCNRCWSKIEKIKDCDGDEETPCPLCRKNIYYV